MIAMLSWNAPAYWFQTDYNQFSVVMAAFAA